MRRRRDTDGWTPAALRHVALGESLPGPEQRVKEAETADVEHDDAPRAVVLDVATAVVSIGPLAASSSPLSSTTSSCWRRMTVAAKSDASMPRLPAVSA